LLQSAKRSLTVKYRYEHWNANRLGWLARAIEGYAIMLALKAEVSVTRFLWWVNVEIKVWGESVSAFDMFEAKINQMV